MSQDQYIDMCEQMGWEINEDDIPKDPSAFALEVQQALMLLNILPDKWEGMSGTWMGKDYAGLEAIMNIYEIIDRRLVFDLVQLGENEMGKYYAQKQKERDSLAKATRGR
jgi:hypothetical protein